MTYNKPKTIQIFVELFKGKSLGRTYLNKIVENIDIDTPVLDVGAGKIGSASYHKKIPNFDSKRVVSVDIDSSKNPSYVLDLEEDKIPRDIKANTALAFNFFEHVFSFSDIAENINKSLSNSAVLYGYVPFLKRVHGDPFDFFRYTKGSLEKILSNNGFENIKIVPLGEGPFVASLSQIQFVLPTLFMPFCYLLSNFLDYLVSLPSKRKYRTERDYPLGYFFIATKKSDK